jgi:DNA-binding beta-propeller fold protein YncE
MKVSPCAKWSRTGITVVGTGQPGCLANELNTPSSISIHKQTNTLYVADGLNPRIQAYVLGRLPLKGNTVVSLHSGAEQIYVDDDDGPKIYATFFGLSHVEKWIPETVSGVQMGDKCDRCYGLSVDSEKNIYLSSSKTWSISKWSPRTNTTTTVVDGQIDPIGSSNPLLFQPRSIYVDKMNGAVYVADNYWHRIQKWPKGAQDGMTVAGSSIGEDSNDAASLMSPTSVFVDEETNVIYVGDTGNNRIQKWLSNATTGETIAGGWGTYIIVFSSVFSKQPRKKRGHLKIP